MNLDRIKSQTYQKIAFDKLQREMKRARIMKFGICVILFVFFVGSLGSVRSFKKCSSVVVEINSVSSNYTSNFDENKSFEDPMRRFYFIECPFYRKNCQRFDFSFFKE